MQWLIDGHNLIGSMPNIGLDEADDEEQLLAYLSRYRARTGHKVTVFFDAGQTYHPATKQTRRGVTAQYAPYGQTADQLIKKRLRRVKNPQAVAVVTSDQAVQQAARFVQVRVVSSSEFAQELLGLSSPSVKEENRAEIKLSTEEVEAWLEIFKKRKHE